MEAHSGCFWKHHSLLREGDRSDIPVRGEVEQQAHRRCQAVIRSQLVVISALLIVGVFVKNNTKPKLYVHTSVRTSKLIVHTLVYVNINTTCSTVIHTFD